MTTFFLTCPMMHYCPMVAYSTRKQHNTLLKHHKLIFLILTHFSIEICLGDVWWPNIAEQDISRRFGLHYYVMICI